MITQNSLLLTSENYVHSLCKPILEPMGITYFNFLRMFDNGSCYIVSSNSNIIHYLFDTNCPLAAPVDSKFLKNKFSYLVLPVGPYQKALHDLKANFNFDYAINLVERYPEYFDLYCFGSNTTNSKILNFYLNDINYLEKFKHYFRENAAELLKTGAKNRINLPLSMLPPYQGLSESEINVNMTNNDSYKLNHNVLNYKERNVKFTKREIDCLRYLALGNTTKTIAKHLNISSRTIETYLVKIKLKLECSRKSEILDILLQSNLACFLLP